MEALSRLGGWLVAVVLVVVAGYLYKELHLAKSRAVETELRAMEQKSMAEERASVLESDAAAAKAEVEALHVELGKLRENLAAVSVAESPADVAMPEEAEAAAESSPPEETTGGDSRENRVVQAQMAMVADMTYKDLFDELGLAPEIRTYMKDAIGAHMAALQEVTAGAMQAKDQTARDVFARTEAMKAELRAGLAGSLTAEELAAWDEYAPVVDQIMYERVVDGQLNMLASGLENENRVLASQVMAEELVRAFDVFNQSDEMYTMTNFNNAQARALNTSLERLAGTLEADQYGQVEGFVNQALAMFEAMAEQQ